LDKFTIRNLKLIGSQHPQGVSLLQVLDKTLTPMGARLMKKWILLPLKDIAAIQNRQQVIGFFIEKKEVRDKIASYLREIGDLERLIAKVPMGKINPRELLQLRRALNCIAPLQKLCAASACAPLQQLAEQLNPCNSVSERIAKEIQEDAPAIVSKGDVIKNGVSETLDELRSIAFSSKEYLLQIQQREIANTGIQSLKIGFNNVFGYYIEVTNRYREQVPEAWQRKQTLANAERYITEELKTYEAKILQAQEKIIPLEEELFNNLVNALGEYVKPIQHNAQLLARLDCLYALANVSENNQYTCPELDESFCIDIKNGRHPVIEQSLKTGEAYVPNDLYLDTESQQIIIITGPNMSGKSALLRQTALIVLLAQMGCYVPAEKATLGITDKIFTRVGASDNLSLGESTFMVEMNETANIMNNLSARSLVLLDEIGRGTSTFDGISIAWALAEYLHNQPDIRPKTLFATHYHELNDLADKHARIKNFHVATHELADKVVFLRKLKEGGSEHSFGIHVARMAAMPPQIIDRAETILATLEEKNLARPATRERLEKIPVNNYQLNLFAADYPKEWKQALALLAKIEINALTPIDALMKLHELKQILTDEKNG
ncbi:MAG: DNA mismatch repair protein MutS, partial [Bacteroidetes bacterium]|nr:DNA mismatch repair protein MutS [Bacteroidota bacterium]